MQTLKLEKCPEKGCPTCKVYNLAQRRISVKQITDQSEIENIASSLQQERCPDGRSMAVNRLNPAHVDVPYSRKLQNTGF